jgi:hypothetical protein
MYNTELSLPHALQSVELARRWESTLHAISIGKPDWAEAQQLEKDLDSHLECTTEHLGVHPWRVATACLRVLRCDSLIRDTAKAGGKVGDERERLTVLIQELTECLGTLDNVELRTKFSAGLDVATSKVLREKTIEALRGLLLPTLYLKEADNLPYRRDHGLKLLDPNTVPVLKLICFLDNSPLVTPQILQPKLLYHLAFRVKGLSWPDHACGLRIQLLSSCPREYYTVSEFRIPRPRSGGEFEEDCRGHIQFATAQSSPTTDLVFGVQCLFEFPPKVLSEAVLVGHYELRFRVSDRPRFGIETSFRQLDMHVTDLVEKLVLDVPSIQAELPTLIPVLSTMVEILGTYAQQGMFKGQVKVEEKDLQSKIVELMRFRLGPEVQAHGDQAGGILDVRYHGVIVELKVEKRTGNRKRIAANYTAQPTQYAGSEARQVSVTLILDLTEKEKPPGDIRNDILLVDVPTHGGADDTKRYPSRAFVFVMNGNIRNPSSYS